jgi:hypothetical protein
MKFDPSAMESAQGALAIDYMHAGRAMLVSTILGALLMGISIWTQHSFQNRREAALERREPADMLASASSVLFLTLGMCSLILLVNNNLARAFALGAAIALVRFKMKFSGKSSGSAILFGILVGMACGVDHLPIAWALAGMYGILQAALVVTLRIMCSGDKQAECEKPGVLDAAVVNKWGTETYY